MQEIIIVLLTLCGPAALAAVLYIWFRVFVILKQIREDSKKGAEIAERIQRDYEEKCVREDEERQRMINRMEQLDSALRARVDHFEMVATGTRERLIKLEQYLKEFFEVELKSVFESFDKTVASILEEMKAELLRGVDRIEEIQAVVDSKSMAQERILDGEGSVYRMISDSDTTETTALSDDFPATAEQEAEAETETGDIETPVAADDEETSTDEGLALKDH